MKKTKKALASLAIAGMVMTMVPFNAFATGTIPTRIAGTTAEQTAVAIAAQTGWTGTAILASSASYGMVDALTSGPLAKLLNAPILLQGPGEVLNADTKDELSKLNVTKVYVTSGTAVISQAVLNQLTDMNITVVPLGGVDRFETSANIAQKMVDLGAKVSKVAVAYGWLNEDALSIASIASNAAQPILLTEKGAIPASVTKFLAANTGITSTDVIGGTAVISDAVKATLPNATRHYGDTAYDTNSQVIKDFASSLNFDNVFVANAETAIDALSGAPLAAQTKSPIVLTDGVNSPAVASFTFSKASANTVVTALGGTAVVPEPVRVAVSLGQVSVAPGTLAIVSVSALDDTNTFLQIDFSKAVTTGLAPSDINIKNAKTGETYGVKTVTLAANGLSAQLELFNSNASASIGPVLQYLTDYTVTVQANGTTLTSTFNRAAFTESRVISIDVANKSVKVLDEKSGYPITLTVPTGSTFDYQGSLGEVVDLWYNVDNEITKSQTTSVKTKTDAIEVTGATKIKLIAENVKYDTTSDSYNSSYSSAAKFKFYLDGADQTAAFKAGTYLNRKFESAKVGYDKSGNIEYVSAYDLKSFLVVDNVTGDEVVGIEGVGTGGSFDATDATIVKDGKVTALADLKKGDVLYFSDTANGNDGYAEVYSKAVTGAIDTVYNDSVLVNGTTYAYDYGVVGEIDAVKAVYIDSNGKTAFVDSDAADSLQAAGNVTLNLDRAGNLVYIAGALGNVASNTKTAILTDNIQNQALYGTTQVQISALLQDGTDKVYTLTLGDLDTITIDGHDYKISNTPGTDVNKFSPAVTSATVAGKTITSVKLTSGTGAGSSTVGPIVMGTEGQLVKLHLNDNGTVKQLELFSANKVSDYSPVTAVKAGDSYINGKKLLSSTLVFDAKKDFSADIMGDIKSGDVTVANWDAYKGTDISHLDYITNSDNEVTAIVIRATTTTDTTNEEAVVTKVLRNTDGAIVSISAYVNGVEKTYTVDSVTNAIAKGGVAVLVIDNNNANLVTGILSAGTTDFQYTDRVTTGAAITSVNVGTSEVTVGSTVYKLVSGGKVIDATDPSNISTGTLADLRGETNVTIVRDESGTTSFVKYFVIK